MADNWRDFQLPDGSYSDDCRPFTQQDVVNYLPTFAEAEGTRSRIKYRTCPGLQHFANVEGPHRGGRDVEGKTFVVSGRNLYQVNPNGTSKKIGVIPGTGFVSMTHNQIAGGNQLVIATGDNSYVYNTVTEVLTATGVALVSVDFLNQRILGVDQARRFWRYSGVATATSWEELDNESAESSPDRIVGGIVSQGEWLVFGERTIEVFSNSPTEATAFQRTQVIEKGCASPHTICRLDNSVFFIGNDDVPYRLNGYTPTPIAPKAIIDAISQSAPKRLYAFTWEDRGYAVYYVTAQDGQTFGYDVTTQRWHRRESYGLTRWRINTLFKSNGSWYAGDALNQRLYKLEWGYVYEGCEIMPRRFRTGVLHNDGNRVSVHGFRLTVATGGKPSVKNCPPATLPTIVGDLPDGVVGSSGTTQYVVSGGSPPYWAIALISGSLPPGASMNAGGLVTYSYTLAGSYSWVVGGVDSDGTAFSVADSAVVASIDPPTVEPFFGGMNPGLSAADSHLLFGFRFLSAGEFGCAAATHLTTAPLISDLDSGSWDWTWASSNWTFHGTELSPVYTPPHNWYSAGNPANAKIRITVVSTTGTLPSPIFSTDGAQPDIWYAMSSDLAYYYRHPKGGGDASLDVTVEVADLAGNVISTGRITLSTNS